MHSSRAKALLLPEVARSEIRAFLKTVNLNKHKFHLFNIKAL